MWWVSVGSMLCLLVAEAVVHVAEVREHHRDAVSVSRLLRDGERLFEEVAGARVVFLILRERAEVVERDREADEIADLAPDAMRAMRGG